MATASQLAIPLSQNTAPVFKFECLYTHDLVRKQKRWQDGVLAFHTFNKRVMVYDLTNNFIGDTHWRETESVQVGDDIRLDRGVLVTVGEMKGRKDQDISEIFVRKNAVREPNLPVGNLMLGRATGQKPRSITAVLEASRNKLNRTVPQVLPNRMHGSSPYDTGSERSPKRQRTAYETPTRQALVEKPLANQAVLNMARTGNQPPSRPAKKTNEQREESQNHVSLCNTLPEKGITLELQQKQNDKDLVNMPDILTNTKKPKKRTERVKGSKVRRVDAALPTAGLEHSEPEGQRLGTLIDIRRSQAGEPSIMEQAKPDPPKQRLTASKSRRKKLIFTSMSTPEADQADHRLPRAKQLSNTTEKSDLAMIAELSNPVIKEPPREVILISSPPKDWSEFEFSRDENSRATEYPQDRIFEGMTSNYQRSDVVPVEKPNTTFIPKASSETDLIQNHQVLLQSQPPDDVEDYSELMPDENLLAALVEDPIEADPGNNIPENTNDYVAANKQSENNSTNNDNIEIVVQKSSNPPRAVEEAEAQTIDPNGLSLPEPSIHPQLGFPSITPSEDNKEAVVHISTLPPTTTALDTFLPETNIPAPQATTKSLEIQPPNQDPNHVVPAEPAESGNNPPTDLPLPKQRALKSIAPIPALLRPQNQSTAQTTYQKPLPQFRPPQQMTTPITRAARSRRSPLQKSLTTAMDGKSGPMVEGSITSLTRGGSDSGLVEMVGDMQREYDDTGPWSREAFDLFGWTPDVPKGRVLGPVAGRACGCRAAAAEALNMAGGS